MRILSLSVYHATPTAILADEPGTRAGDGLELVDLDGPRIAALFGSAPRAELFPAWLRAGYRGLLLTEDGEWVCIGWLATPSSPPAVHLPSWAGGAFWIFNCHTRAERRGEGHYQRMLVGLVRLAAELGCDDGQGVFVDAMAANVPAVKAIERVGFRRAGRVIHFEISRLGLRLAIPIGVPRA